MREPLAFQQMSAAMRHHLLDEEIDFMASDASSDSMPDMSPMPEITRFPRQTPLAMAYVPVQHWNGEPYSPEIALQRGTIFRELDLPFGGDACDA